MDIKSLIECRYVKDVVELGSSIEFKTFLYSFEKMSMDEVLIRCPVSGDFILTECAKIVGNEDEDNSDILGQLFITMQEASSIEEKIDSNEIAYTPLELKLREASSIFLSENKINEIDAEDIKFKFLATCSKNFIKVYEQQHTKRQQ
jgi:hypothetical protein